MVVLDFENFKKYLSQGAAVGSISMLFASDKKRSLKYRHAITITVFSMVVFMLIDTIAIRFGRDDGWLGFVPGFWTGSSALADSPVSSANTAANAHAPDSINSSVAASAASAAGVPLAGDVSESADSLGYSHVSSSMGYDPTDDIYGNPL